MGASRGRLRTYRAAARDRARCLVTALVAWLSVRIIGRRSLSQMTAYDFAAILVISNVAAEPLVYKAASKARFGSLVVVF